MFGIGTTELILILVIILIIFGVGKLPSIGSGVGQAIKNFKKASSEVEKASSEVEDIVSQKEEPKSVSSKSEEPAKKV